MPLTDKLRLFHGPYRPPPLRRGDRAVCLVRDCEVIVTGLSDARIPWPRCRHLHTRSAPGLLIDDELARAVRLESAEAVKHWWGVGTHAVWRWRRALGVTKKNNPSSRRLLLAAAQAGAEVVKRNGLPDHVCDAMSKRAKRLNLIRFARRKPAVPPWTAGELRVLAVEPDDAEVAERIGRSVAAVRVMRWRMAVQHRTAYSKSYRLKANR